MELGFAAVGAAPATPVDTGPFDRWLGQGCHGAMSYLERNREKRRHPEQLAPGTRSVLVCRMDYLFGPEWPHGPASGASSGFIARYARGRDYHKVMRQRLKKLAARIEHCCGPGVVGRICVDSAPIMEKEWAMRAGLGWRGKNTLLVSRQGGSFFVLGEILLSLSFPWSGPEKKRCGSCRRCLDACPTGALGPPGVLDARRCLSYLTIEHTGVIPEEFRPQLQNRVFGCDTCQTCCPWNRFAQKSMVADFAPRFAEKDGLLADYFLWDEAVFKNRTAGTPVHRLGHERWLRNVAVALGNGPSTNEAVAALQSRAAHPSALVREHVSWALARLQR